MGLLILLLGLFKDGSGQDGAGNAHRRRCGTTGDPCDGNEWKEFFHGSETFGEDDNILILAMEISPPYVDGILGAKQKYIKLIVNGFYLVHRRH